MESADGQLRRDGSSQRRSPFDVIMSQIRRKRSASDRKPLGRFLSRTPERMGIPEDAEPENRGPSPAESERDVGWGRVCVFLQKLGKNSDSRSLSVAHCDLTATDLLELASLLPFLPQLEDVDLSWNELIGGSLRALTSHLQLAGGIRMLRLCSCRLKDEDIAALGEALGCLPLLEVLDLSWNSGVGGGALGLLGKLQPSLKELHLVACQLTAADAASLGGLVADLPKLSLLDVSYNPQLTQEVDAGGFRELSSCLSYTVSLTVLQLQACGLTPHSLEDLGSLLCCLPSVRELDLSCNKQLTGGLNRLTPHLAHVTHLEILDLHLCRLSPADLEALIQVLPSLSALMELDVSSNEEVGGVVSPLVSALQLSQMRRLPLSSCRLNDESFTALALAAPYLRSLDLSWSKVVGGRLFLLLDALQPSVIVELHLSSCDLTTDDLRHLAEVSKHGCLSSLRVLDLSYNGTVGADGWMALFTAGGLGSLEDADLSLRPSTSAPCSTWLPALLGALPRMPALARLALRRWTVAPPERQQLTYSMKNRNVQLELDQNLTESEWKSTNQEEGRPPGHNPVFIFH
uniref:Leucine rich repeat containing 31 n=1 Tax=Nothobranchius pienaari TaxID=704102 RepID=A0A1A8MU94_9TELE